MYYTYIMCHKKNYNNVYDLYNISFLFLQVKQ